MGVTKDKIKVSADLSSLLEALSDNPSPYSFQLLAEFRTAIPIVCW